MVGVFNDFSTSTGQVQREKRLATARFQGPSRNSEGTCLLRCLATASAQASEPFTCLTSLLFARQVRFVHRGSYDTTGDFKVADLEKAKARRAPWRTKTSSVASTSGVTTTSLMIKIEPDRTGVPVTFSTYMYVVDLAGRAIQLDGSRTLCPSGGSGDALNNAVELFVEPGYRVFFRDARERGVH